MRVVRYLAADNDCSARNMSESEELGKFLGGVLAVHPELAETCFHGSYGPGLFLAQYKEKGPLDISPVR